jgi:hypothetical protein
MALAIGGGGSQREPVGPDDKVDPDGVVGRDVVAANHDDPARIDKIRFDEDTGDPVVACRGSWDAGAEENQQSRRTQAAPRGGQPQGAGPIVNPGNPDPGRYGDATLAGHSGPAPGVASTQVMRPSLPPSTFGAIGEFAVM